MQKVSSRNNYLPFTFNSCYLWLFWTDNFGNTPLLEAIKSGHDKVASLLSKEGALLKIDNAGSFLCTVVARGDSDFLRRVLSNGIDPNSRDYDHRTPLHIAAAQGLYLMAKLLVEAGASVFSKDRYNSFSCNWNGNLRYSGWCFFYSGCAFVFHFWCNKKTKNWFFMDLRHANDSTLYCLNQVKFLFHF